MLSIQTIFLIHGRPDLVFLSLTTKEVFHLIKILSSFFLPLMSLFQPISISFPAHLCASQSQSCWRPAFLVKINKPRTFKKTQLTKLEKEQCYNDRSLLKDCKEEENYVKFYENEF